MGESGPPRNWSESLTTTSRVETGTSQSQSTATEQRGEGQKEKMTARTVLRAAEHTTGPCRAEEDIRWQQNDGARVQQGPGEAVSSTGGGGRPAGPAVGGPGGERGQPTKRAVGAPGREGRAEANMETLTEYRLEV